MIGSSLEGEGDLMGSSLEGIKDERFLRIIDDGNNYGNRRRTRRM